MTTAIAPAKVKTARFTTVEQALVWAETNNVRIRIHRGTTENTRRFSPGKAEGTDWGDIYDVAGTIGHTTGPQRSRILLNNSASISGMLIGEDSIVRIRYANRSQGGDLYRHPNYTAPPQEDYPSDWAKQFA